MTSIVHDHLIVKSTDEVGTNVTPAGDLSGTAASGHEDISLAITEDTTYYSVVALRGTKDMSSTIDTFPTLH